MSTFISAVRTFIADEDGFGIRHDRRSDRGGDCRRCRGSRRSREQDVQGYLGRDERCFLKRAAPGVGPLRGFFL